MTRTIAAVVAICSTIAVSADAQFIRPEDALLRFLHQPDFVIQHQRAIGLSEVARDAIQSRVRVAQAHYAPLLVSQRREMRRLGELLASERVDESAVLEQLDRVLPLEREIKRTQMVMLVGIRNALTAGQRSILDSLRGPPGIPTASGLCSLPSGQQVEQVRQLARQLHPEAYIDTQPGGRIVGLVFDNACRLMHHGVIARDSVPGADRSLFLMFPGIRVSTLLRVSVAADRRESDGVSVVWAVQGPDGSTQP